MVIPFRYRFALTSLLVGALALAIFLLFPRLRHADRYRGDFAAIDCPVPPGTERDAFLREVQYLGGLPDRLPLLDADASTRLAEAFGRHPWVERVERVEIRSASEVVVRLDFRVPKLLVLPFNRVVDRHGVLLPTNAPTDGLPVFTALDAPPPSEAGKPWGDAAIEAAARR